MKKILEKTGLYFIIIILTAVIVSCGQKSGNSSKNEINKRAIKIIVSILPQKYFVKRIGGSRTDVWAVIRPGQSPSTYEPTPGDMAVISEAEIFFKIGVPFETAWEGKIRSINPKMKVVDTRKDIELRDIESFNTIKRIIAKRRGEGKETEHVNHGGLKDPHIWLNPVLVKKQAETIFHTLSGYDPDNSAYYEKRYAGFINELDRLDMRITGLLKNIRKREILVFHPSWGYYTDRYDLKQIPVEIEGKEPGQKELSQIIDYIKSKNIKTIFIQKQFSAIAAKAVARSINGRIIVVDPLAENYIENMISVTKKIAGVNR